MSPIHWILHAPSDIFLCTAFGKVHPSRIQRGPCCPPLLLQKESLACWCHHSSRTGYHLWLRTYELLDWNLCQCLKVKPYAPHHYLDGWNQCKEEEIVSLWKGTWFFYKSMRVCDTLPKLLLLATFSVIICFLSYWKYGYQYICSWFKIPNACNGQIPAAIRSMWCFRTLLIQSHTISRSRKYLHLAHGKQPEKSNWLSPAQVNKQHW